MSYLHSIGVYSLETVEALQYCTDDIMRCLNKVLYILICLVFSILHKCSVSFMVIVLVFYNLDFLNVFTIVYGLSN